MSSDEVDTLLERYLLLLDQYTTLRATLKELQSSIHQSIARANFSSERGVRYGQDFYDERMQAVRELIIAPTESNTHSFSVRKIPQPTPVPVSQPSESPEERSAESSAEGITSPHPVTSKHRPGEAPEPHSSSGSKPAAKPTKSKDPIRMFGMLVPQALRDAQRHSIQMVEEIIPKILGTDAEMKDVEIEIRRARKKLKRQQAKSKKGAAPGKAMQSVGTAVT